MNPRTLAAWLHDLLAVAAAWLLAYQLRFNFEMPPAYSASMWLAFWWVLPLQGMGFALFGLYRGLWRFASIPDLRRIALAVGVGALAIPAVLFMLQRLGDVPRSVLLLYPMLLLLIMGGSRFVYRSWKDGHLFGGLAGPGQPVLILGAGEAAAALLKELGQSGSWLAVGLLDDDPAKAGGRIGDAPILGRLADVAACAARTGAATAIIAMPSAAPAERRRAAELATAAGLQVLTVPAVADLLSGRVSISHVRKVELEDLLGREAVHLDDEGLGRLLSGKVVLVTGAGGSIGAELARQIARFAPRLLVFYELSEYALYAIEQEFAARDVPIACIVGDVKDAALLAETFSRHRPQVVFHAAAYKHVPLMENANAWSAVRNNVLGTLLLGRVAAEMNCEDFVLVSTDKAVNPVNVMGASKRLAERVCQALQRQAPGTRFTMVRFGNVLDSSGSVVPRFREQIARGGPVTVTHPDIIRYFMLIPEAAQLVLQAGLMGKGGEIFVLDMGEPVRIVDLARDMIRLSGFAESDIDIRFVGLRPGEKLYEELLTGDETTQATPHPKLRVARGDAVPDAAWLDDLLGWLAAPVRPEAEVKSGLLQRVPEYRPAEH